MTAGLRHGVATVERPSVVVRRLRLRMKRVMDVIGSTVLLFMLAPLLAAVAVAVKATSRGPVIFRQTRLGLDRKPFTVYKFRSMRVDADPEVHRRFLAHQLALGADGRETEIRHFKVTGDCRVTPVGQLIRRLSIDELPQLVNVLRGEMSLVGPRPDLAYSLEHYQPHHYRRFDVVPGLTGLWQVSGRSDLSYMEMLELDVAYAESWSLSRDIRILARTIPVLLTPDRAG